LEWACCHGSGMRRLEPNGFTVLELLIVLVVGGILTTIAVRSFSQVHGGLGTHTAVSSFMTMHAQARALAVERGRPILLVADASTGRVSIEETDGTTVRERDFADAYDVTIGAPGDEVRLCMTARGFADPRCGNVNDRTPVTFTRGGRTRTLVLLPLGQALEES
jgi:prepilin-type N-terminal cleavage/methylation domain-containing protein